MQGRKVTKADKEKHKGRQGYEYCSHKSGHRKGIKAGLESQKSGKARHKGRQVKV